MRKRERLNAGRRQQHMQQWARRLRTDRTLAAQAAAKIDSRFSRTSNAFEAELKSDPDGTAFAFGGVEPGVTLRISRPRAAHTFLNTVSSLSLSGGVSFPMDTELTIACQTIAFSSFPGTLHAHGQLHEVHRASYSVGRVGKYLLHIQLRQQALPLPGSPFSLTVKPGPAHAIATKLPASASNLQVAFRMF